MKMEMERIKLNWKASDGQSIYGVHWKIDQPKAVLCLVHGLGEHVERYDTMATYYASHGITTIGLDLRGHGQTGGKKGYIFSLDRVLKDLDLVRQQATSDFPGIPAFFYGHSMGGNIVLNYVLQKKPTITGAIISGPWIYSAVEPSGFFLSIIKLLSNVIPTFSSSNNLDVQSLSRDQAVIDAYKADPLVHDQIAVKTAAEMVSGAQYLRGYNGTPSVPILVMHGTKDTATDPNYSEAFVKRINQPHVSYKPWVDFFHEIHNEPAQKEVFNYAIEWINRHL